MKTRRRAMMTAMATAGLAIGVGSMHSLSVTAEAQHGHASDPEAHFNELAQRLALTAAQRATLAEPLHQAFAAMEELHRLHAVIAAELTDEQKGQLGEMIHEMMSHVPSEGQGHPHDRDGRR